MGRLTGLLVTLATLAGASAWAAEPRVGAADGVRPELRGINIDPINPWANPSVEVLKRLGITRVRFVYKADHERMFEAVERYTKAGLAATLVLNNETADMVGARWPPSGKAQWLLYRLNYLRAAGEAALRLRRFGDRVSYQIWNEENIAGSYVPPEKYGPMARLATGALRLAHPGAGVVLGSLLHDDGAVAYLEAAVKADRRLLDSVDSLGVHLYGDLSARSASLAEVYGRFGKPLSLTEWGECGWTPQENGSVMRAFLQALDGAPNVAEAYYFGWSETQAPGCGFGLSDPLEAPNAEGELYELRPPMAWAFREPNWERWEHIHPDIRLLFEAGWGPLAQPRWETEHALDHDAPGWRGEDFPNIDVHDWARDFRARQ